MNSPASVQSLQIALHRLCPAHTGTAVRAIDDFPAALPAIEAESTAAMTAVRFREFAWGRACARAALTGIGIPVATLPIGPGRAPVWPPGIVGSIAHTRETAVAVAARQTDLRSIGIDIEATDPLDHDLLATICNPAELAELGATAESLVIAKLLFSAKESIYKCLWPITGTFIEFADMRVRLDPRRATFTATSHGDPCTVQPAEELLGAYFQGDGLILTAAWLPR